MNTKIRRVLGGEMEINKRLLLSFLALSSTLPVYSANSGKSTVMNKDRLYNNMIEQTVTILLSVKL